NSGATGDLDLVDSVQISGVGSGLTRIDGAGLGDRVFHAMPGENLVSAKPFTVQGKPATESTPLNDLDSTTHPYSDGETILITGRDLTNHPALALFTYGAAHDGTTLGALLTKVRGAYPAGTVTVTLTDEGLLDVRPTTPGPRGSL